MDLGPPGGRKLMENFENPLLYTNTLIRLLLNNKQFPTFMALMHMQWDSRAEATHYNIHNPLKYEKGGKNEEAQVISGTS